jgi:GNAT superfamily N-acetyltransferase
MVIGIIGENCSGKSTLAEKIKAELGAEIVTGKDYLRMAKSESEAVSLFREKLRRAVSGDNIIYVISDPEHVKLLPDGAIRILVTADLETIKERFRARMRGNLPAPVALMLERKHGMFDSGEYDYRFDGATGDAESFCEVLKNVMRDSVTPFSIRRLSQDERQTALDLAWAVFSEYESPDYSAEGTEEFRKCLHDEGYLSGLHYYGTFDGEKLIGEIAIRPDRKHICFFFVDGRYHRRGIGTRMFRRLLEDYPNETITLNSSPYGLPFYKAIGFVPTDEEKTVNGIRFTPMKYEGRQVPGKPTERNE